MFVFNFKIKAKKTVILAAVLSVTAAIICTAVTVAINSRLPDTAVSDKTGEYSLLLNDGDFAHSITSPKKHVDKKYVAKLDGEITEDTVKAFSDGIEFSDGTKCRSAVLECDENDKKTGIVTICEGKYHQVKKMFLCCGLKVVHLQRISIGGLYLDSNLHIGECKLLTDLDKKSVFIGNIH